MKICDDKTSLIVFLMLGFVLTPAYIAQSVLKPRLSISVPASASSLAYSSNAKLIAVGQTDGSVSVWDTGSGNKINSFIAGKGKISELRFIPQTTNLVALTDDNKATIWQISDGKQIAELNDVSFSFEISDEGKSLVAQDSKQVIWLWNLESRTRSAQLTEKGNGGVRAFTFSPDGNYVICSYGGKPYFIDLRSKQNIEIPVNGDSGKPTKVKIKLTGKDTAAISLGKMEDDDAPTYRILAGKVSPTLVLSRRWMTGFVDVWNTEAGKNIARLTLEKDDSEYQILDTSLSFDDNLVAIGGAKNITVWDVKSKKRILSIAGKGLISFAPANAELAISINGKLDLYSYKP